MELKGIEKLNQFFTEWLQAHDFDCVAELGTDFNFWGDSNIIHYALVVPNTHDMEFVKLCQEYRPEIINCDNFLLSFFHEVGHFVTENDFSEKEWNYYYRHIVGCGDFLKYYKYPIEWEATKWACDYIVENEKEIASFCQTYSKLIKEFLEINGYDFSE